MAISDVLSRLDEIEQGEKTQAESVGLLAQSAAAPQPVAKPPQESTLSTSDIIGVAERIGAEEQAEAERQKTVLDNTSAITKLTDTAKAYAAGSGDLLTQAGHAVEMLGRSKAIQGSALIPEAVAGMDETTFNNFSDVATGIKPGQSVLQPLSDVIKHAGKTTSDYWDKSMSEGGQILNRTAWQDAPGAANKLHAAVLGAARSAPQTISIGYAGKALTGLLPLAQAIPGVAKGLTRIGLPAPFAQKAAEWMAGGAVYGSAEGISAGLSNAAQVGEDIDKMDLSALSEKSPKFNEYLAQLDPSIPVSEREAIAKGMLKEDAENMALWATAGLSTVTGSLAGAGIFDKVLSSKRFLLNRALGGLKEAHQEFWQSGLGEKLPANLAMQQADQGIGAMDDVWHESVAGAGPGAIMGLVAGGGGRHAQNKEDDSKGALERNLAAAQLERMNLPTRDLIAIRNGEFHKVPYAAEMMQNMGLTPEHIDGVLENRYSEMSAARATLERDINQGPLVRAATMATTMADDAISRDKLRRDQQDRDTRAAIDQLAGTYNPSAPAPTEQTNRRIWPAVDQTTSTVHNIEDRKMQGEWDAQADAAALHNKTRNTLLPKPGDVKTRDKTLTPPPSFDANSPAKRRAEEVAAFDLAFNRDDDTPENRAAWVGSEPAVRQEIEDRKMQGEWDAQEQAARDNLAGRFLTKKEQPAAEPIEPTQRQQEIDAFEKRYNEPLYDVRGELVQGTGLLTEDTRMEGEWARQSRDAAAYNLAKNTPTAQQEAPKKTKAEIKREQEISSFDESYNAIGTVPESRGNVTDEEAAAFEKKVERERAEQRRRAQIKAFKARQDEADAAINDEAIPDDVKKAAAQQAHDIINADPVYKHLAEAKKRGKINLDAMREAYDSDTIGMINRRYPGIFSLVGTINPDEFASEMGYENLDSMVRRFSEARTKKELTGQIIREKTGEWQQAENDQQDYFGKMAEREQGREWTGAGQPVTKQTGTVFPAPDEAVSAVESMIKRKPKAFSESDFDHWTYTADQQSRLRTAHREALSALETSDNNEQAQQKGDDVAGNATTIDEAAKEAAHSPDNDLAEPTDAQEEASKKLSVEEELAATSDEDLAAMLDDVFGEQAKPVAPKKPAKPRKPAGDKHPQQKQPTRTAGQITKEGGIAALEGVKSAMEGLNQLFGGKNRLGSGMAFDEETYAKAKPHFVAAWNDAKRVGYSLKELLTHIHNEFGKAIRPYLERFLSDVKAGNLTVDEKASTVNQVDKQQQQPEGGQDDNVSGAGTEENGQPIREDDTAIEGTGNRPLDGVAPEVRQGSDQAEPATDGGTGSGNKGKRGNQGADGGRVSKPRGGRGGNAKVHPAATGTGSDQGDGGSGALTDAPASIPAKNFIITDDVGLGKGGQAQKYRDNIAAIRILKQLRLEQRRATPDEQKSLARYVGWGGIPNAFRNAVTSEVKEDWKDRVDELEGLLTKEELDTARNSTQNAHYTAGDIVTSIWKAVRRLGFNGGLVLEPSVGTGNFLGLMPQELAGNTKFIAAEFDGITAGIAQALYPQEGIFHTPFEKLPLPSGEFDLVIGNPPFGQSSLSFAHLPSINRHSIHNQFFLAGLDALKPGGVQAFVVSRHLMDAKDSSVRREIAGQAKLLAAIRLPQTAFKENALTDVVTDIIFLQKNEAPVSAEENVRAVPSWFDTVEVIDKATGEPMTINSYFAQNPSMVMGTIDRSGSMRYEGDITVRYTGDNISRDIESALNAALTENIVPRNDAVGESKKRLKTMADALEIALSGAEDGSISIDKKTGKLVLVREMQMGQSGSYMLTNVELSPGSPWSNKLTIQDDGTWIEEVDQVDANGNKVKRIIGGKTSKLNAKELKRYTDQDVPDSYRLGQLEYDRLRDAVSLLDTLKAQINLEMNTQSTDSKIEANRKRLENEYGKFVDKHKYHLSSPVISKLIAGMPDGALLLSLEASYTKAISADQAKKLGKDPRKAEAEPSAILSKRVIFPYTAPEKTSNPQDALAITLSEQGKVDVDMLADLLDKTADEVATELHDKIDDPLIYKNPETGQWETADEYLGGNVVQKLHAAKADGLEKNVEALAKIQPEPWGADKVTVMPGATWVPETVYADFITHLTGAPAKVRFGRATNTFAVVRANDSTATAKQWSTEDRGVSRIVEAILNSKTIRVTYTDSDGRIHVDQDATELANIKLEEVKAEFSSWVFRDGERRRLLVDLFNKKYNVRVNRQRNGQHLKFPGKVPDHIISLRRHQKNGVWRGIVDRFVLYDHAVGAGKTFTGIARALERKRMGLSRKPMIIVPNHLVEQFAADVYKLYPGAKVLAAGKKDLEKSKRRRVFAKIATGDWDIVIVPHSSFAFIGIDPATETRYLEEELKVAEEAVKEAEAQAEEDGMNEGWRKIKPLSVKQAEALRDKLLERLKKLKDRAPGKDRLLTFEQMGVDDLTVDEAHEFKNLFYSSNMQARGMNPRAGSAKAYDLWLKSRVLRDSGGSIAFMTGTPISNSAVEMYGLMRYLAADEIVDMGIDHFDAWRAQFVDATTEYEPTESGRGLKEVNRLGRDWSNMRSLMDLYYSFADCVTNDDIKKWYLEDKGKEFPIPRVKGGGRVGVNVKPTPGQESELQRIVAEFEALPDEKDIKIRNAQRLRLMDQARKISLDVRSLNPKAPGEPGGKLELAAKRIHDIYKQWNADKGTQLVFLDRSVPKSKGDQKRLEEYDALLADLRVAERTGDEVAERKAIEALDKFDANEMEELRTAQTSNWNGYQQIKNDLVAMGIPANEIRFVQEANTDEQKQAMFDEVNAGAIRVLIGSTPRMGAGTNVQERLVALHHVDVTWKPSDIEQREGRIIRQKNKLLKKYGIENFEVEILAYTTESTVDAKLWSLNSTKLRMINGIRQYNGEFNMEFDDEDSVGMAEIAAIASGDPMQLERVKLDGEIKKLERQQSAFRRQQWGAQEELDRAEQIASEYPDTIPTYEELASTITAATKTASEEAAKRTVIIDGKVFSYESLLYGADENPYRYVLNKRDQAKADGEKFSVEIDGETTRSTDKAEEKVTDALGDEPRRTGRFEKLPFDVTINGEHFFSRDGARRKIADLANQAMEGKPDDMGEVQIGTVLVYGIPLSLSVESHNTTDKRGEPVKEVLFYFEHEAAADNGGKPVRISSAKQGTVLRINNKVNINSLTDLFDIIGKIEFIPTDTSNMRGRLDEANESLPSLREKAAAVFPRDQELSEKRKRLASVEQELASRKGGSPATETAEPDGGVQLSKTATVVSAENRANIEQEITAAIGGVRSRRLVNSGRVVIVDSQQEIQRIIDGSENNSVKYSKDGTIHGAYVNGTAYLVRDGIEKGQAFPVLLHELGEHAGKLGFTNDAEYQSILKSLENRKEAKGATGDAIRAAMARVPESTKPEYYWSEVAAYLIENNANEKLTVFDRIKAFFKKLLVKAGLSSPDTLSHKDLVAFARAAVNASSGGNAVQSAMLSVKEKVDQFKAVDTNSDNFKRWFKGSEVVDEDGKPLVVYHGTRFNFDEFDETNPATWFSQSPELASDRYAFGESVDAGANIVPAYVSINNPFIIDGDMDDVGEGGRPVFEQVNNREYIESLKSQGYDGIVVNEDGKETFAVFSPTQIKSAISNTGEFSNTDPRIQYSKAQPQTATPSFLRWFGTSKITKNGQPHILYHGTQHPQFLKDKEYPWVFDQNRPRNQASTDFAGLGIFLGDSTIATAHAGWEGTVHPFYVRMENPYTTTSAELEKKLAASRPEAFRKRLHELNGHDGIIITDRGHVVVFEPNQVKSATDNSGAFSNKNKDVRYSNASTDQGGDVPAWQAPPADSKADTFIYNAQDKLIDMKRIQDNIEKALGPIQERHDVRMAEELYHKRSAKRVEDVLVSEINPLMKELGEIKGADLSEFEEYMHALHAPEANESLRQRNPNEQELKALKDQAKSDRDNLQKSAIVQRFIAKERELAAAERDVESGDADDSLIQVINEEIESLKEEPVVQKYIKAREKHRKIRNAKPYNGDNTALSGMSNEAAEAFLAKLPSDREKKYQGLAQKWRQFMDKTRSTLVKYELESQETVDGWAEAFENYVPLHREDMESGMGIGQGFSVKGSATRSRTGSNRKVVDILAHIVAQRERAIVRGEKAAISKALYGLAAANPNPEVWTIETPPTVREFDPVTGLVVSRPDPMYKNKPNAVVHRFVNEKGHIEERAVLFNEQSERGMRLAQALKNLDTEQLGTILRTSAILTRWFSAINTQYNLVFGPVNAIRDAGSAMLHLTGTPLAGRQKQVAKRIATSIKPLFKAIWAEASGKPLDTDIAKAWREMQLEGGTTGFRDMFENADARANDLKRAMLSTTKNRLLARFNWVKQQVNQYNDVMENVSRLAVYMEAKEQGLSRQRAASLAKNITLNFNRKGKVASQAGAMYAFFNASMQGTEKMYRTMKGPAGKKILAGGLILGAAQAVMLAAAGFGDDEPPEFIKERSLIIPVGGKKYVTIPMPLGFNIIPNISRVATEWILSGGKNTGDRVTSLIGSFAETFNPIGNAGFSVQTIAPTVIDPLIALSENKDWTGKPIAKQNFNTLKPTPGHERMKDTASAVGVGLSRALNFLSGGTEYTPGLLSPTPDQIDYLIGQALGGVGRETLKAAQVVRSGITGEELPVYKIPLVSRFYGDSADSSSVSTAFYRNVKRMNMHAAEIEGLTENRGDVAAYLADNPDAKHVRRTEATYSRLQRLQKGKRALLKNDAPREQVDAVEKAIKSLMSSYNQAVEL